MSAISFHAKITLNSRDNRDSDEKQNCCYWLYLRLLLNHAQSGEHGVVWFEEPFQPFFQRLRRIFICKIFPQFLFDLRNALTQFASECTLRQLPGLIAHQGTDLPDRGRFHARSE